jgi:hypothetical protein
MERSGMAYIGLPGAPDEAEAELGDALAQDVLAMRLGIHPAAMRVFHRLHVDRAIGAARDVLRRHLPLLAAGLLEAVANALALRRLVAVEIALSALPCLFRGERVPHPAQIDGQVWSQ